MPGFVPWERDLQRQAHLAKYREIEADARKAMDASEGAEHRVPLLTRRYRARDFSPAEWQAPEKDHKLALYREAIASVSR